MPHAHPTDTITCHSREFPIKKFSQKILTRLIANFISLKMKICDLNKNQSLFILWEAWCAAFRSKQYCYTISLTTACDFHGHMKLCKTTCRD